MTPGDFTNLFFIAKILNKYWVFEQALMGGRMEFLQHTESFHTKEDAHKWIVDKSKELSTDACEMHCVEIEGHYLITRRALTLGGESKNESA